MEYRPRQKSAQTPADLSINQLLAT